MAREKRAPLWVPRTSVYMTYGLSNGEPIFKEVGIPGRKKSFTISIGASFGKCPIEDIYWIIPPPGKPVRDLKKAKDNLIRGLSKAVNYGLIQNTLILPNNGLVMDPSSGSLEELVLMKSNKKPNFPEHLGLRYLADQIIPILNAFYGSRTKNTNKTRLKKLAYFQVNRLFPSLINEQQRKEIMDLTSLAMNANPRPISSRDVFNLCKKVSLRVGVDGPMPYNGVRLKGRYPTLSNVVALVNGHERENGNPSRYTGEVKIAIEYLKRKGKVVEVYEKFSQPSYRVIIPLVKLSKRKKK